MTDLSIQQIQQRLTCPVCLDRYKQPKLLPCQHTFCLHPCLTNLYDRTSRKVKCPECRSLHNVPMNGVDSFPNNITIQRFLDLDLSNIQRLNNTLEQTLNENCAQCNQKHANHFRCLDCERYFCVNCKPAHLKQLTNETKQCVSALRRILPKLSQNVGNFEQRKNLVNQNYESLKREISSVIEKMIADLRDRERCLHAEADVFLQSQLRTIGLENENAEIELASVSSFCDATEASLNREMIENDNTIGIVKKQCVNFLAQANNLSEHPLDVQKIILEIPNLNGFANYIRNFGTLMIENNDPNQFLAHTMPQSIGNSFLNNNTNTNNSDNFNMNQYQSYANRYQQEQPFSQSNNQNQRNRNERPIMGGGGGGGGGGNVAANTFGGFSGRSVPNPVGFNVNFDTTPARNGPTTTSNRQNNRPQNNANNSNNNNRDSQPAARMGVPRSNTFVIEREEEPELNARPTRSVDLNAIYNVRPRPRAKTPVAFNFMLDEPASNAQFDETGYGAARPDDPANPSVYGSTPAQPKVNYGAKRKARLCLGKQGKEYGEFVWPMDVQINTFNNHILVSDSNNHRVQIFEADGKFLKCFGRQGNREGQFDFVSGLFVDSMSNIFVVDRLNHRVQIFDRYTRYVRSIGSGPGNAPGQLNHPWGVAVNRISEIFVCDKENDRICVFHLSGRFLRSFGSRGTANGQFDKPFYVHVTRDSKVLVSDSSNHRVQAFDGNGVFLYKFGREGSQPGELKYPRGLTTDAEGFILVADSGNNRIQVFRPDGTYVSMFGAGGSDSGKFKGVEGLVVNKNGDVLVCDRENNRVQIL